MVFDEELNKYIHLKQEEVSLFADEIKEFNHRSEYYKIKNYLDDFIEDKHVEDRFIVMPGLRGLGKTTILFQLYNYLVNEKDIKIDSI
ncbi:MAG: AAA family ATPase, partial [Methanobrevibacter sp.]|nr:AAA family ATPase [Candidatus Methanoflexus mossambicus]